MEERSFHHPPGDDRYSCGEGRRENPQSDRQTAPSSRPQGIGFLSISIGVASFPENGRRREELVFSADQALYFAKKDGRNRVCRYCDTLKAAIEKDQNKLTELLRNPEIKTIRNLAAVIDAKSPYTRGHSEGVIEYALLLADALNLGEQEKQSLRLASLLHNIGIVSIPDSILNKPGPLSTEERKIIQAHPGLAQMLIKESHNLDSVLPAILYHHERYDGKGYPNGLKGEEIPFLTRVLGVVEAYHAMISVRPYRPKMSHEEGFKSSGRTPALNLIREWCKPSSKSWIKESTPDFRLTERPIVYKANEFFNRSWQNENFSATWVKVATLSRSGCHLADESRSIDKIRFYVTFFLILYRDNRSLLLRNPVRYFR